MVAVAHRQQYQTRRRWDLERSGRELSDGGLQDERDRAGVLTCLPWHGGHRRRLPRIHVGWGDALDDRRVAANRADHAAHELGQIRLILEEQEAPGLIGKTRARARNGVAPAKAAWCSCSTDTLHLNSAQISA